METLFLIIFLLLTILIYKLWYNYNKKKEMGTLTGKYYHLKTPNNNYEIKVQLNDCGFLKYRNATNNDIKVLVKYKYLKP